MQERHGYIEVTPAEMDSLDGSVRKKPKEEWRVGEQDVQEAEETIFVQPVKKKKTKIRGQSYCWMNLSDWRIQRRPRDFSEKFTVAG